MKISVCLLLIATLAGCRRASVIPPEPPKPEVVRVAGVSLVVSALEMKVGDRAFIKYEIVPKNADVQTVGWSTADAAVATVDAAGEVNALVAGVAKITVKTLDGGFEAECVVTVVDEKDPEPPEPPDPPDPPVDPDDPPLAGEIGNLKWALSLEDGVLTVGGAGDLPDFEAGEVPWNYYRDRIERLVLPASMGRIGENSFAGCENLTLVECAAPKPPELGSGNFDAQYYDTLVVPKNAAPLYRENPAWWEAFVSIQGRK